MKVKPGIHPLAGTHGTPAGRILVVDDNESNRDMLSRRLQHEGYDVCMAANGHEALALLNTQEVDLILLDVMMPDMDGYEVLVRLKSHNTLRDIPVIMISALDEIESVVRCIEQGAEDYLSKPFDPVLLRARIGACLEKKRLRDQEVLYLKDVGHVTHAAAAVEAGKFAAETLSDVSKRPDELGQLARVFERMAREVAAREEQLKQQIQILSIEIDQAKKARQVSEITDTEYFQELRKKAKELRAKVIVGTGLKPARRALALLQICLAATRFMRASLRRMQSVIGRYRPVIGTTTCPPESFRSNRLVSSPQRISANTGRLSEVPSGVTVCAHTFSSRA